MKLYIYPSARKHVHDDTKIYRNTVPLSIDGINKHAIISNPEDADYFYMGQIPNEQLNSFSPSMYPYFEKYKNRHIVDIEGEGGQPISSWLHDCIITTMGPLKRYSNVNKLFTRPTFSHLLLDIIKNRNEVFSVPNQVSFGFRGYLNHRIRAMMIHALHNSDFDKELNINKFWSGPSEIGGKVQNDYIQTMNNNLISLCPRGSGIDSVRLIETCYYSRVPVLISNYDYYLIGEDSEDLDFVYRIVGENLTPDMVREQLQVIYDTPVDELEDRAHKARKYFDSTIRNYFEDPTAYFIKWIEYGER